MTYLQQGERRPTQVDVPRSSRLVPAAGAIIGWWAGRRASDPVLEAVARGLEEVGRGDLEARIAGDGSRGARRLAEAFDEMALGLKDRIAESEERSLAAGRSEKAGEVIAEVQRLLIPERVPQIEGFEVAILVLAEGRECGHFSDGFEMEGREAMVVRTRYTKHGAHRLKLGGRHS